MARGKKSCGTPKKLIPKYKKGGSVFKPHMMYKGNKAVKANTMKDHLRLKKLGYVHTKPKNTTKKKRK